MEWGKCKSINKEKVESIKAKVSKAPNNFSLLPLTLGDTVITISPSYYRPTEVDILIGDASKAKKKLNWSAGVKFSELVKIMVEADVEKVIKKGY